MIETPLVKGKWSRVAEDFEELAFYIGYRHQRLIDPSEPLRRYSLAKVDPQVKIPGGIGKLVTDFLRHVLYAISKLDQRLDVWRARLGLSSTISPPNSTMKPHSPRSSSEGEGVNKLRANYELEAILKQLSDVLMRATALRASLKKSRYAIGVVIPISTVGCLPDSNSPRGPVQTPDQAAKLYSSFVRDVLMFVASTRKSLWTWEKARGFCRTRAGGTSWLRDPSSAPVGCRRNGGNFNTAAFLLGDDDDNLDDGDNKDNVWTADYEESAPEPAQIEQHNSARTSSTAFSASVSATAAAAAATTAITTTTADDGNSHGHGYDDADLVSMASHPCGDPVDPADYEAYSIRAIDFARPGTAARVAWVSAEDHQVDIELTALPSIHDGDR